MRMRGTLRATRFRIGTEGEQIQLKAGVKTGWASLYTCLHISFHSRQKAPRTATGHFSRHQHAHTTSWGGWGCGQRKSEGL